jgi:hypothetical protein
MCDIVSPGSDYNLNEITCDKDGRGCVWSIFDFCATAQNSINI